MINHKSELSCSNSSVRHINDVITMDCMCCADGGVGTSTDNKEFLGSICRLNLPDGSTAKFPVEKDRYILCVAAGCPFAARPWIIQALYGLPIDIIRLFPATADNGWFFEPKSEGENELVGKVPTNLVDSDPYDHHHLSQ
jgi:glutathionyl-hydroquinone reductase